MIVAIYDKPGAARPLVTSQDPELIRAVWIELASRLDPTVDDPRVILRTLARWDRAQKAKRRHEGSAVSTKPTPEAPR